MITINKGDAEEFQEKLLEKCAFPQLQDGEDELVWNMMGGGKDDFYIYDANGELVEYLPFNGEIDTNLSKEEGFAYLKNAIKNAFGAP